MTHDRAARPKDVIGLVARLVLGGALLIAGVLKVGNLGQMVVSVRAYKLLPETLVQWVGHGLPFIEILLGLLIVLGAWTRWTALLGTLMMLAFIFGISWAWAKGLTIDCGCFGGGGQVAADQTKYPEELARDALFTLCGLWLVVRPASRFALDHWLRPAEFTFDDSDTLEEDA